MKKFLTLVMFFGGFLSASYAIGQIYNDKSDVITGAMDRVAEHHANVIQGNTSYDAAIERHFNAGVEAPANQTMNAQSL